MAKQRLKWNVAPLKRESNEKMQEVITKGTLEIHNRITRKVSAGQSVRRTKSGGLIGLNPSKEGEAPKVVSGRYKQSFAFDIVRSQRQIIGRTGTNQKQARRLELGFVGVDSKGRRISQGPRPHMMNSLRETIPYVRSLLRKK